MGTLTQGNPNARELVTEILEEEQFWSSLKVIVEFLRSKAVDKVRVELGYVLDRDNAGQAQPDDQIVELANLERVVESGMKEGTIEWRGMSDFLFYAAAELAFMLCNDGDIHIASSDSSLLMELGRTLRSSGIKVYDSGNPI